METDFKYLQFPLCMLRELFIDREKTIAKIISFGIYRFAKIQDYDLSDVAKQMMYCYYRKQGDLTNDLYKMMQRYIDSEKIYLDEDYNGFSDTEFNPETQIDQILNIFGYEVMTDEINVNKSDTDFMEKAIEFYQIRQAYSFLGINGDFDYCLKRGKEIERTIPAKEPYPSINKKLLFEFRDHEKTEFDLMQFACYIAIRSILGKKPYCRTNKEMILCRAFGYASIKHLPATMHPDIKELFKKYKTRYHADRVLEAMQLNNWGIHVYSHNKMRGLYIGLSKKITLENLIMLAETKKRKYQIEQLKQKKAEARQRALQQLNKEQQLK